GWRAERRRANPQKPGGYWRPGGGGAAAVPGLRGVAAGAGAPPATRGPLRPAGDRARHSDAPLTPVLAGAPPGGDPAARQPCPALVRLWHEAAWQQLWAALDVAWGAIPTDLSVQPVVQRGHPGPVLVAIAGRPDDLLVVGAG